MSDDDKRTGPPRPPGGPKRTKSGEHPLKTEARKRLESFSEHTLLPQLAAVTERMQQAMHDVPTLAPPVRHEGGYRLTITIRGRGPHHNADPGDANRLAQKFIAELRANGHEVEGATFDDAVKEEVTHLLEDPQP